MKKKIQKNVCRVSKKLTPAVIQKVFQDLCILESQKEYNVQTSVSFEKFSMIKYVETVVSANNSNMSI